MRESEENNSLTWIKCTRDTEEHNRNGISICVTHRYGDKHTCFPKNIPNSETSPPAFCALVDVVAEREDLGPADLMVVLDIINEGENINSDKFSPEPILTDLHKLNDAVQRTSPETNKILGGYKFSHINIHLGVKPDKSRLLTSLFLVEKMVDIRKPEHIDSQIRRIFV